MRIVAAMSGGVDSSVVAALLHEAGHEVIGVTLQLYDHGAGGAGQQRRKGACCAGQDIHDARDVADRIGIPHYVLDREARFRAAVIDDFAGSYAAGLTPVPCVRCNQSVKFTDLLTLAHELSAEALATGHYARRIEGPDGPELHRAADERRDQSWFLFATTPEQLGFIRFPVGGMPDKQAVRAEAARLGLPVADKPDSQDICFVPSGRYADFVGRLRPESAVPGEIVAEDGTVLGRHAGLGAYTVGQASRLGGVRLPARDARGGEQTLDERPVVTALDPVRNRVVVGPRDAGERIIRLGEVNWLCPVPRAPVGCTVKLRARETPHPATIRATSGNTAEVVLEAPALAAPGQACVAYHGSRVLGGGFIRR